MGVGSTREHTAPRTWRVPGRRLLSTGNLVVTVPMVVNLRRPLLTTGARSADGCVLLVELAVDMAVATVRLPPVTPAAARTTACSWRGVQQPTTCIGAGAMQRELSRGWTSRGASQIMPMVRTRLRGSASSSRQLMTNRSTNTHVKRTEMPRFIMMSRRCPVPAPHLPLPTLPTKLPRPSAACLKGGKGGTAAQHPSEIA